LCGICRFLEIATGGLTVVINVKVQFFNTVDGSTMKELKGTSCYCIDYVEKWEDGQDHYEQIEIVCQKLENGAVAYDNPWK
jgi:hypothetical protein